jgi:lactoylglutathione lyase
MLKTALFASMAAFAAAAQTTMDSKAPLDTLKPTLDVGIIVSDIDKAMDFYGVVLGLKLAGRLPMPDGNTMYRFQAGTAILKVRTAPKATKQATGVRDAVGFRLLTLYVEDFAGVVKRWTDAGNAAPAVMGDASKFTFITDPDGNAVELVSATTALDRIAIGLTVSDVEQSRAFYRTILALPEEKPEKLALLNGESKYTFLAGKTQIKFWKGTSDNLPKHTGNISDALGFRYFTFMVKDVDTAAALLKSRGAKVVVEPVDFGKIARIMMIEDPDGNWIELASLPAKKQ